MTSIVEAAAHWYGLYERLGHRKKLKYANSIVIVAVHEFEVRIAKIFQEVQKLCKFRKFFAKYQKIKI